MCRWRCAHGGALVAERVPVEARASRGGARVVAIALAPTGWCPRVGRSGRRRVDSRPPSDPRARSGAASAWLRVGRLRSPGGPGARARRRRRATRSAWATRARRRARVCWRPTRAAAWDAFVARGPRPWSVDVGHRARREGRTRPTRWPSARGRAPRRPAERAVARRPADRRTEPRTRRRGEAAPSRRASCRHRPARRRGRLQRALDARSDATSPRRPRGAQPSRRRAERRLRRSGRRWRGAQRGALRRGGGSPDVGERASRSSHEINNTSRRSSGHAALAR
jgi:hypothetical protein